MIQKKIQELIDKAQTKWLHTKCDIAAYFGMVYIHREVIELVMEQDRHFETVFMSGKLPVEIEFPSAEAWLKNKKLLNYLQLGRFCANKC